MFYLLRILNLLLLTSYCAQAVNPEEEIIHLLSNLGYSTASRKDIKELRVTGSNTKSIYKISIKNTFEEQNLICKQLKDLKAEQENLKTLEPFMKEYESFKEAQPFQFPPRYVDFARYKGASTGNWKSVLFDEASGDSVFNLMLEWTQKGYGWSGLKPLDTRAHLAHAFRTIGGAIASFHLEYGDFQEETKTFSSVLHGDLHTSNVFYNLWTNKTTLIDYETMAYSLELKGNIFTDIKRLVDFSKHQTAQRVEEEAEKDFCKTYKIYVFDEEMNQKRKEYVAQRLKLLDDFFDSMKEGYTHTFSVAGYNCDIEGNTITKTATP